MIVYRHDGSFEGLLSAFAEALQHGARTDCDFVPAATAELAPSLFGGRPVRTDPGAASRLLTELATAGGEQAPRTLAQAFLSELPGCEHALFEYCLLTLERQECVDGWLSQPAVARVLDAVRRVGQETHRFQGLLRFMETEQGVYYAPFEPDHCILLPLSRYFANRLRGQHWLIHDRRRDLAVLWDGQTLQPAWMAGDGPAGGTAPALTTLEQAVQHLWRTYHRQIAIATRANPKRQRQFMPRKYWRYLTEMQTG
jgi:probable DNA metabolism protein